MHKTASCYHCKQAGHIATICPQKQAKQSKYIGGAKPKTGFDDVDEFYSDSEEYDIRDFEVQINNIKIPGSVNSPYHISLTVGGKHVKFQIDTGAGITAVSSRQYKDELGHIPMEKTTMKLSGYSGEPLQLAGVIRPKIELNDKAAYGRIYIVHNGGPPILGRNMLNKLGFQFQFKNDQTVVHNITSKTSTITKIFEAFPQLFDGKLGTYNLRKIKVELKPGAVAKFCRARPVPFAFQRQYDDEFDTLEKIGVISRTDTSDWGTPVVPVLKPNGKIRICGDYKTTINQHLVDVKHPSPRVEELFAKIKGGEVFTKHDLSRGYNRMVLDDDS